MKKIILFILLIISLISAFYASFAFEIEEKAFRQVNRKKPDILMIDVKWGTWFFIKDGMLYVRYYSWNSGKYVILPWEQAIRDKEIGTFLDDLARGRLDNIMRVNILTE